MTPNPPEVAESALPKVALICSLVGLLFPPLLLLGLALGSFALVSKKGSRMQALLSVVIPLAALVIFGILFAVQWPKYQAALEAAKAH